jgi:hypothetical protein
MSPAVEMGLSTMSFVNSAPDSREPTSIVELPNELLIHIFESITSDDRERCKTFSAISRVNQHFRSIITPLLYRKFEDCCARHLQLFGRTVLSNRGCAELVKYYEGRRDALVFNSTKDGCPMVWSTFALDQTLEEAVAERLPDVPKPVTRADFSHALTCILPRLQQLDLRNGGDRLIEHLASLSIHANATFQQLSTLEFAVEPARAYQIHDISLLLTLPCLQTLVVDMAALNDQEGQSEELIDHLWHCDPRSSTVQELTLERCGLPVSWITTMIMSCRTLRQFHHEHYYWDNHSNYYPQVVQALEVHHATLSDVRLNELNGCKVDSARQLDPSQPVSFQHFTSLTHLDIPLFSFSTRTRHCQINELLPCNLQVLTLDLRSAREGFSNSFFESLAEAASDHLPSMKSVEVVCRIEEYREEGFLPLHFCHLRRMFSSYGIELLYFLEFVQCEFKAGTFTQYPIYISFLTRF